MHYINGLWVDRGTHPFTSENPATGEMLWQGVAAGPEEVAAAVAHARQAFPAWAALTYAARGAYLQRFSHAVDAKRDELATLIAQETGKTLWDARSEAAAVVGKLAFAREAYQERTGTRRRASAAGNAVLQHRPHGVMAVYGPYNFPAHLPNGHIMPALLAGNTVVFKPSEQTPLVGEWMARQWAEAGLPAGVLALLQGERETGVALAAAAIDGLLFTGSSATGATLHCQLGGRPEIMLALEMGGNNPLIVAEIADIRAAVHETLLSAFTSSGQRCTCARRVIVAPWAGMQAYIDLLVSSAARLTVGAYDESPEPFMGPLISLREAQRLMDAQAHLEQLGGRVLLRMRWLREGRPFLSPAIIDMTGVDNVPDAEYFGPLMQLYRADSHTDAVAKANASRFGLSGAILCDDPALFQTLSGSLRAGLINWNRHTTGASGAAPFGGIGLSGNHRPAGYYAADYCAYPVASLEMEKLALPAELNPGITIG